MAGANGRSKWQEHIAHSVESNQAEINGKRCHGELHDFLTFCSACKKFKWGRDIVSACAKQEIFACTESIPSCEKSERCPNRKEMLTHRTVNHRPFIPIFLPVFSFFSFSGTTYNKIPIHFVYGYLSGYRR